jgi:hypothetical protein
MSKPGMINKLDLNLILNIVHKLPHLDDTQSLPYTVRLTQLSLSIGPNYNCP